MQRFLEQVCVCLCVCVSVCECRYPVRCSMFVYMVMPACEYVCACLVYMEHLSAHIHTHTKNVSQHHSEMLLGWLLLVS